MSRSDELPPDQRAALALLLRQRKSHAEVAELLKISERAVHDRAHAALIVLAPREARELSAAQRERVGEYLLGQQAGGIAEQMRVRGELASAGPARAWALALAGELAPIAGERPLPEIPPAAVPSAPTAAPRAPTAATGTPAAAPSAPQPQPEAVPVAAAAGAGGPPWESAGRALPVSRLGGALLLAVLLAAIVATIVLVSSGSSHKGSKPKPTTTATTTGPQEEGRFVLKPPDSSSTSTGVAAILSEKGNRALFVQAEHIPASKGFFYAIWLYNSATSALPLSRSPAVGKSHRFAGAAPLPANASEYKEILITRETSTKPSHPGHVVLRGPFKAPSGE